MPINLNTSDGERIQVCNSVLIDALATEDSWAKLLELVRRFAAKRDMELPDSEVDRLYWWARERAVQWREDGRIPADTPLPDRPPPPAPDFSANLTFLRNSCTSKTRYGTEREAECVRKKATAKRPWSRLRVYSCVICGGFHLTKSAEGAVDEAEELSTILPGFKEESQWKS